MYKLYTDGGSRGNPGEAACGALLFDSTDNLIGIDAKYLGTTTNNCAEYEGLIMGIKIAIASGVDTLEIFMDSELIVKQLKGEYKVKDDKMKNLYSRTLDLLEGLEGYSFTHVKRAKNKHADKLVNIILDSKLS